MCLFFRAAFHADNPLAPEVKELKTRLEGSQQEVARVVGEHQVTKAKLELAQKNASAGSGSGGEVSEAEVSKKEEGDHDEGIILSYRCRVALFPRPNPL
jgi:hypothetical protein